MPIRVCEDWRERQNVYNQSASMTYHVAGVGSVREAAFAIGEDGTAVRRKGASNPWDPSVSAEDPAVTMTGPQTYKVIVPFRNLLAGAGGSGGEQGKNYRVLWQFRHGHEQATVDWDAYGRPIVNSAKIPFSENPSREFSLYFATATRWQTEYELSICAAFANTINADRVFIPRVGAVPPGWLKCMSIEMGEQFDETVAEFPVSYHFEIRFPSPASPLEQDGSVSPFDYRLTDKSRRGWYVDGTTLKLDKFQNGKEEIDEIPLDGHGMPLSPKFKWVKIGDGLNAPAALPTPTGATIEIGRAGGDTAVFLRYPKYPRVPFAPLRLFGNG